MNKKLTVFEGMCIITGYGIGSGVLLLPYYISTEGFWTSMIILAVAFLASCALHLMIGDVAYNAGENSQIISIFNKYLFQGKGKTILTWLFFGLMLVTLLANLAIYISGSALLISSLTGISEFMSQIIFYVFAASFVFFGLKVIGVCEKFAILAIGVMLVVLMVMSFFVPLSSMPTGSASIYSGVVVFAKMMFVFVAFFSVPQVVNGLRHDKEKIKIAIVGGIGMNMVLSLIVVVFSLAVFEIPAGMQSSEYLAIVEWTKSLGTFAEVLGVGVTIIAFLTTFWSISLALSDIVKEQLNAKNWICWLFATLPSLLITIILPASFESYIDLAGGVIAILIVILLVPTYLNMLKHSESESILKVKTKTPMIVFVLVAYIMMAVGSMI